LAPRKKSDSVKPSILYPDGTAPLTVTFIAVAVSEELVTSTWKYWNSPSAYPMELLDAESVSPAALEKLRSMLASRLADAQNSRYANALRADDAVKRLMAGDWPMQWAQTYRFVSDDPNKATMAKKDAARTLVASELLPMVQGTEAELSIISPYFVPGDKVTATFVAMAGAGKNVRILTNSLVANDVAAVHGGYSRYRKPLVEGGVQIWELKPTSEGSTNSSLFGSSDASLHTKAFAFDSRMLFVGSYNLDPRSTWLNCEQGVMVDDPVSRNSSTAVATHTNGEHAWHVTLVDGHLRWSDGTETFDSDPKASGWQRFQAWITRVLHLDAQL
jgi:putative cardiolipin synthase